MRPRQCATISSVRLAPCDEASQWREALFPVLGAMAKLVAPALERGVRLSMKTAAESMNGALLWLKRLWPLLALLAATGFVFAMGWQRYLTLETLAENREALRGYIDGNMVLSLLGFVALYAAVVALSLPGGAVLTIAGGFLFGWFLGGVASIIAATIGASIIFLIARTALGDVFAARAGPWLSRFREGFQEDAFSYLLFLRLVPIFPFWLVNLAPSLLGVKVGTYVATTFLGIIPGTFAYSLAGKGLDSVIEAQAAAHQSCLAKMGTGGQESCSYALDPGALLTPELIIGLVALGVVALVPVAIKWLRGKRA
jgi:uncharacterized membrane protein YdjX (TVP38/TMEM64 family)